MLLLLDNFEQVVQRRVDSPSAGDLPQSFATCYEPGGASYPGRGRDRLPALAETDSVLLFCERAQHGPSADIHELCRRLDGLPLAIELAAARARMLSPAEVLARLSQRLDLLKGGRDADPRQQTLRAAIEWSHDLLSEPEQVLFRRLAVFAGNWTFEAAVAVVEAEIDTLQSLYDKSLLRRTESGRFFMLETIREYARERLVEAGETDHLEGRHAEFLLAFAERTLETPTAPSGTGARARTREFA